MKSSALPLYPPRAELQSFFFATLSPPPKIFFFFLFPMPRSKFPSSDSNAEVRAAQEKYLAVKAAAQERKKRKKEEAEQK